MLGTVPSPSVRVSTLVASPVRSMTAVSPWNRPEVRVPVRTTSSTALASAVLKFSESILVCPVFHVMVNVVLPPVSRSRQLWSRTELVTVAVPDGHTLASSADNRYVERTPPRSG